eukprot:CAMPEP_0117601382 /NCGR_PEP_ID=MMETSP0784-20121206/76998_1 /TAXON_ID=39447 /ORGANISM="" /LENGTH=88 /DNA_ID=CAMNT_0005404091 /DNA_START=926 /DNA_END=1192 /DNA_ORIENTATION=+
MTRVAQPLAGVGAADLERINGPLLQLSSVHSRESEQLIRAVFEAIPQCAGAQAVTLQVAPAFGGRRGSGALALKLNAEQIPLLEVQVV